MDDTCFLVEKLTVLANLQYDLTLFRPLWTADHERLVQEDHIENHSENLLRLVLELHKDIDKALEIFKTALRQIDVSLYNCLCLEPSVMDYEELSISYIDNKIFYHFMSIEEMARSVVHNADLFEDSLYLRRVLYAINNKLVPLIQRQYNIIYESNDHEMEDDGDDYFVLVITQAQTEYEDEDNTGIILLPDDDCSEIMSTPELLQSVLHNAKCSKENWSDVTIFNFDNLCTTLSNPEYSSITMGDIMSGESQCNVCFELVSNKNFIWSNDCNHYFCNQCTLELYKYSCNLTVKPNVNNISESENSIAANCPMCRTLRFVESLKGPAIKDSMYIFKSAYIHD